MTVIDGEWHPQGMSDEDALIKSPEELENYIEKVGLLPLFSVEGAPDFSAEAVSPGAHWWTGDALDVWEWRAEIAARGKVAYGKFFGNKAGFISREWFPIFAAYRRDGYDFDARWDDDLATLRQKKIMDTLEKHGELLSSELKTLAGFGGASGEKGYSAVVTQLEMQTYIVTRGFRRRVNKKGEPYGWAVGVYSAAESLFPHDHIASCYSMSAAEAYERIFAQAVKIAPESDIKAIKKQIK